MGSAGNLGHWICGFEIDKDVVSSMQKHKTKNGFGDYLKVFANNQKLGDLFQGVNALFVMGARTREGIDWMSVSFLGGRCQVSVWCD